VYRQEPNYLIIKTEMMKKKFLNLRQLGLVLLAAGSMAMYSCEEASDAANDVTEATTEMVEEETSVVEEVAEEVMDETTEVAEEVMEGDHKCEEGKCDEGKCDGGH